MNIFRLNKKFQIISFSILLIFLGSCSSSDTGSSDSVTHAPVKFKGDKRYSLLNLKTGEAIFQDEYENKPSLVNEGVFYTKNSDGEYEYHRLEKLSGEDAEKSLVSLPGGPYLAGGIFNEGIAIVVEKNERPKAIDENGEVVFEIDADQNLKVIGNMCISGRIQYKDSKSLMGFLNKKGEIVIPAQFTWVSPFQNGMAKGIRLVGDKREIVVINKDGEVNLDFDKDGYIGDSYDGDFIAKVKDDKYGIINTEKDEVITFDKKIDNVWTTNGHLFFERDNKFGVLSDKGDKIIRSRYDHFTFLNAKNSKFIAQRDDEFEILDGEGNTLFSDDGKAVGLNNDNYLILNGKYVDLYNSENEELTDDKFIFNDEKLLALLNSNNYSNYLDFIESDYFDFSPIVDVITNNLTKGELFDLKLGQSISEAYPAYLKVDENHSFVTVNQSQSEYIFDADAWDYMDVTSGFFGTRIMLGRGFKDRVNKDTDIDYEDTEYTEAIDDTNVEEKFEDVAPEVSRYTSNLNKSIIISEAAGINMAFNFSNYLKTPISKDISRSTPWGPVLDQKVIGMKWNENALLTSITGNIKMKSSSSKSEELIEKIESNLKDKAWKKVQNNWVKNNLTLNIRTSGGLKIKYKLTQN